MASHVTSIDYLPRKSLICDKVCRYTVPLRRPAPLRQLRRVRVPPRRLARVSPPLALPVGGRLQLGPELHVHVSLLLARPVDGRRLGLGRRALPLLARPADGRQQLGLVRRVLPLLARPA